MKVIFLGQPGSGKGTQSQLLAQKLNLKHLSVGQLLRDEYQQKTKLGIEGFKYWGEKGINVPSKISFSLLKKYLLTNKDVVLDNFPRTAENLKFLNDFLKKKKLKIDFVFYLNISEDESVKRLLKRRIEDEKLKGKSREDETEELITIRQKKGFEKDFSKIINFYKKAKVLFEIDGSDRIETIHGRILDIIKNNG